MKIKVLIKKGKRDGNDNINNGEDRKRFKWNN